MLNICDSEEIDAYLAGFAKGNARLEKLLLIALKRILSNRRANLMPVSVLSDDAPTWAHKKLGKEELFIFHPKKVRGLDDAVGQIAQWLDTSLKKHDKKPTEETAWLDHVNEHGMPWKLLKINSLEELCEKANDVGNKKQERKKTEDPIPEPIKQDKTISVVKVSEDKKYFFVRLENTKAVRSEGEEMGHCLGGGDYDGVVEEKRAVIYSLRDRKNRSHVTIELDEKEKVLQQCKGKGDKPPVEKYVPYVQAFVKEKKLSIEGDAFHIRLMENNGVYYDPFDLPDNFVIHGDLNMEGVEEFTFPRNLQIKGELFVQQKLACSPALKSLQVEKLFVTGTQESFADLVFDTEKEFDSFLDNITGKKIRATDILLTAPLSYREFPPNIKVNHVYYYWDEKDKWPYKAEKPSLIVSGSPANFFQSMRFEICYYDNDNWRFEDSKSGRHRISGPARIGVNGKREILLEEWYRNDRDYRPSKAEKELWDKKKQQEINEIVDHFAKIHRFV